MPKTSSGAGRTCDIEDLCWSLHKEACARGDRFYLDPATGGAAVKHAGARVGAAQSLGHSYHAYYWHVYICWVYVDVLTLYPTHICKKQGFEDGHPWPPSRPQDFPMGPNKSFRSSEGLLDRGPVQGSPAPPRTYYLGTGALKGPLRAYYLGTWGARATIRRMFSPKPQAIPCYKTSPSLINSPSHLL